MRRLVAAALIALPLAGAARADPLPPRQKALVLLRVLVYDRNLRSRAGQEVQIAVVFRPGDPDSELERDGLLTAFAELGQKAVVAGLPLQARAIPWKDASDFDARIGTGAAVALLACTGLKDQAAQIARVARGRKVLAVAASRSFVESGFAVAIVERDARAGLLIDPRAALDQGADFDSALLSIAEVIRGPGARP